MERAVRIFYGILAFVFTAAISILAFSAIFNLLNASPSRASVAVDYNGILTVLLTTITVIFTVCAIVLAILGVFGFRNLKREAGRFAEAQALEEIRKAFGPAGGAIAWVEQEMQRKDGHHRQLVERRIREEVISLLPLVADRINFDALNLAIDEPTDEGHVD